jgi:predicted MFS family arabinose efflux permease
MREWKEGWPLVLTAIVGGIPSTFGILVVGSLIVPLQAEFGWSRADISTATLIGSIPTFFLVPMVGRFIDRYGTRRIALASMVLHATAFMLLPLLVGRDVVGWWIAWAIIAVSIQGYITGVWAIAITTRFQTHRGLALGVMMMGVALAYLVVPLAAAAIAQRFGWRAVFPAFACLTWFVILPLSLTFLFDGTDLDRKNARVGRPTETVKRIGLSFSEALRTPRFWLLVVSTLVIAGAINALLLHLQALFTDRGLTPFQAAACAAAAGPGQIFGRLGGGFLLDRFKHSPLAATTLFLLPIAGCISLLPADSSSTLVLAFIAFGAGAAVGLESDMMPYFTARYFGMRAFGSIYGLIFGGYALSVGVSSVLAGAIFDFAGSYAGFIWGLVVLLPVGAMIIALLGRYPYGVKGDLAEEEPHLLAKPASAQP